MTTVTLQDIRTCHYCARGARAFFARHDLDWSAFCKHGVAADTLMATDDAMAQAAVAAAEERERNGQA